MELSDTPNRAFFEKLRNLQADIIESSSLLKETTFSPTEVIILRAEEEKEVSYYVVHVNHAYEYYIQKTIPITDEMPEISKLQIKNIKTEKAYYEYLRKKIFEKFSSGKFQDFRPTTEQLDKQIPSYEDLSRLFQSFLDNDGAVPRGDKLTLKKWAIFDCCDQVFSSLGTRAGLNLIGDKRKNLHAISHKALENKALGTWLCRPSVSSPDDEKKQIYCRTIVFIPYLPTIKFNALRIIHVFGLGFFQANDLDNPSSWQHKSSLIEILELFANSAFILNRYVRVDDNLYRPISREDESY